jgi:hypothetical protein
LVIFCELTIVALCFQVSMNISSLPLLTDSNDLLLHYCVSLQLVFLEKS